MLDIEREIRIVSCLPRTDFISSNTTSSMVNMDSRRSAASQGGGLKATAPEFTPGGFIRRQRSVTALKAVTDRASRRHSRQENSNTIINIISSSTGVGGATAFSNQNPAGVVVPALVVTNASPDSHHANNNNVYTANNQRRPQPQHHATKNQTPPAPPIATTPRKSKGIINSQFEQNRARQAQLLQQQRPQQVAQQQAKFASHQQFSPELFNQHSPQAFYNPQTQNFLPNMSDQHVFRPLGASPQAHVQNQHQANIQNTQQ